MLFPILGCLRYANIGTHYTIPIIKNFQYQMLEINKLLKNEKKRQNFHIYLKPKIKSLYW